jgi:hypothetical protein
MIAVIVQSAMHRARRRLHPPVMHDVPEIYPKRLASFLVWLVVAFVVVLMAFYPAP